MTPEEINKFYTIKKTEFNFSTQKMKDVTILLHAKGFYPPTMWSILKTWRSRIYPWELSFKLKDIPEHIKTQFAKNIVIQKEIIDIIKLRNETYWYTCWIIKAKTWIWKSHIIMDIIEYLQQDTLILVSNKKLMAEMMVKFKQMTNIIPTQYGDGKKNIWNITIMTKSSFLKVDKKDILHFWCVLVDELQTGFTDKFRYKLNKAYNKKKIALYWLSATPSTWDLTERELNKYYWKTIDVNIEYDFIPSFIFYNYYTSSDYEFKHYAELKQELVDDKERFKFQKKYIVDNLSKTCSLILCDRLEEIERWNIELWKDLKSHNIVILTWKTKTEDDNKYLQSSKQNGKPTIIIWSIQKCATWFDHPLIDKVFIFSSIKFENTVIQSVGRALRKSEWKLGADIYLWNDMPILKKQRLQKISAIVNEYWIKKEEIEETDINKRSVTLRPISLIF